MHWLSILILMQNDINFLTTQNVKDTQNVIKVIATQWVFITFCVESDAKCCRHNNICIDCQISYQRSCYKFRSLRKMKLSFTGSIPSSLSLSVTHSLCSTVCCQWLQYFTETLILLCLAIMGGQLGKCKYLINLLDSQCKCKYFL